MLLFPKYLSRFKYYTTIPSKVKRVIFWLTHGFIGGILIIMFTAKINIESVFISHYCSNCAIISAATFIDLPKYFIDFIESRLDKSCPTITKPIIPAALCGEHQYA